MERIGEYIVKRLVGEGGMGKVYEAEERLSGRRVALKLLRPELTRADEGRRLFVSEMQILAHLDHPNIVRSLASMEQDGQLVLVLEYLEGKTLREEIVSRGKLPWPRAVDIAAQMADALRVAHEQSPPIVHRDLKPENVMLCDGEVKVMDFGIAMILEGAQTNTQSVGTLQYMSPEQIDAGVIDGRSDLYSLGLVLYEMLAGKPPFCSASPRELLNMQCTKEPPELPEDVAETLPSGVEELVFRLLSKKPEDRPATAAEVVGALEPLRARRARKTRSAPVSARPFEPAPSVPPSSSPSRSGARSGDTLHSAQKVKPRTDTVALVENAARGREVPTWAAVVAIVMASLLAGSATYFARFAMHGWETPHWGWSETAQAR
jgi:serine/threonine-protein kinase